MDFTTIYAGIGSRETPTEIQGVMTEMAKIFASLGWTLRSGHADGADKAFEKGCIEANGKKEIFVPWAGFNGAPKNHPDYRAIDSFEAMKIAAQFHPAWDRCSFGAKRLHTRNVLQILGEDLQTPVRLVVCWTKDGLRGGGTGQALRIAEHYGIPIMDLALVDEGSRVSQLEHESPRERLRAALERLLATTPAAECEDFHHPAGDWHGLTGGECGPLARFEETVEQALAALREEAPNADAA